jgi:rifampicin phosphotransferase
MSVAPWIVESTPSRRFPVWTRANVGEVFPDPVGPLSFQLMMWDGAELGWRDAWEKAGAFDHAEFKPDEFEVLGIFGGYCYLNASVFRVFGERTPGLSADVIDALFFGAQPGVPPYEAADGDVSERHTAALGETLGWVMSTESIDEIIDDTAWLAELQSRRPDFDAMTNEALWAYAQRLMVEGDDGIHSFRHYFKQHIWITMLSSVPPGALEQICAAVGRPDAVLKLQGGLGEVESAAPSFAMWQLGRQIRSSASLTAAFDEGVAGVLDRVHEAADAGDEDAKVFEVGWADFLSHYGCRGPNEWELRVDVWETKHELALAAIERMRLADDDGDPTSHLVARGLEREHVRDEIAAMLAGDPCTQGLFLAACRAAMVFNRGRERTKTNAIRLIHEGARLPLLTIGRRMVDAGHFVQPGDVGLLQVDEVGPFLADPAAMRDAVVARRELYATYAELQETFVFAHTQPSPNTWARRGANAVDLAAVGDVLTGVPGCPGVVRGRARVVLDSLHPAGLEPGDILVAPSTDPSWTPLFVPAGGVVVNVGAPQSHAMIVSRELGIPCVPSVTDATRRIPDGALVEVDGGAGTVTVLEVAR